MVRGTVDQQMITGLLFQLLAEVSSGAGSPPLDPETVTERHALDPVRIRHEKARPEALMDPSAPADTTTASTCILTAVVCDLFLQNLQKGQREMCIFHLYSCIL